MVSQIKAPCTVALVGATGAVGQTVLRVLEERKFPVKELRLIASERSSGRKLLFSGKEYSVQKLEKDSFGGVDIAFFSSGADRSKEFAPLAVKAGAVVIDNSSAFRSDPEVPLIVPEVNAEEVFKHKGIIANPNCSTIQLVVVLKPLHQAAGVERVVVSTYQSVSGAGAKAMQELFEQTEKIVGSGSADTLLDHNFNQFKGKALPAQIAFNVIPHIDEFQENGYTKEELKMVLETQKIMTDKEIRVTATTVRVPVFFSHSESVNIAMKKPLSADQARGVLEKAPGVSVVDSRQGSRYPLAVECTQRDEVFVGRIRQDETIPHGLNLWIVSDNLRKGAATNAVQIAEVLIKGA
jgi:aspartate-semialdehyde dehydrogenase